MSLKEKNNEFKTTDLYVELFKKPQVIERAKLGIDFIKFNKFELISSTTWNNIVIITGCNRNIPRIHP